MSVHIHTYTYIHTRTQNVHMNARKARLKRALRRQRLRGQPNLTPRSSALLPVRITTARRPDHIRLSALVRSRSTPYLVHASSQLGHGPPKRGYFPAILAGFFCIYTNTYTYTYIVHTNRNRITSAYWNPTSKFICRSRHPKELMARYSGLNQFFTPQNLACGRIRSTGIFKRIVRVKGFASNCFDKMQNGLKISEKDSAVYDVCQV